MEKPTNPFYTKISTLLGNIRTKISYSALLGILVGLALTIMTIDIYAGRHMSYIVKIDNNAIGYVQETDEFKYAVKSIELTDGKIAADHIKMEKTKEIAPGFISSNEIEKIARERLGLKMPSVSIIVDGEEIFKLRSQEEWDKVKKEVESKFIADATQGKGTVSILSSTVKEKVEMKNILVDTKEVLDINDAVQKIIAGKGEQKKYVIKNGDTIWDIALKNGISVEEIHDANPDVNLDKIKIDQEIKLAVSVPYISMEIVADVKGVEEIAYDTQQIKDNTIARGATKVKQNGKAGQAEIEKKISLVNGEVVSEEVLKTNIIANAVDKIVVVGTKAPTYSSSYVASAGITGSGQFSWPARGRMSSGFGRRWGRMHYGIDLPNPTGTPVGAADSGTVVFAAYSGSFGNLIRISHGNGLETYYAHLSKINVRVGENVSKGQNIGAIGNTGRSTGSHLHFEVRKNGTPVNPLSFLN